jgi:hypothetical protein
VLSRYTGDCEWVDDKTMVRVGANPDNQSLSPAAVKRILQDHVRGGGFIYCKHETRENWKDSRNFVYWAVIPVAGFDSALYVEMELFDSDPRVHLLNAHPASFKT